MLQCPICGEYVSSKEKRCPFCRSKISLKSEKSVSKKLITVNLEENFPICDTAKQLLYKNIFSAKREKAKILKIIHGYGSSGVGGELRFCLREYLNSLSSRKIIRFWTAGEQFSSKFADGNRILSVFPWVKSDSDYNRQNKGVTLIVL